MNAIDLAIFSGRLNAICDEMGYTLQRSALSPNIKDRLDFSCAIFDAQGGICAQAAHIPVHLGSMAYAMADIVGIFDWQEGDVVVMNDPFLGGTHLPDVTLIRPLFSNNELLGFVACRAHHANIGADSAGSMPLSSSIEDEGVLISPRKLFDRGEKDPQTFELLQTLEPDSNSIPADFLAQVSALRVGIVALGNWLKENSVSYFHEGIQALNDYGQRLVREYLNSIEDGVSSFEDYLDDDGFGQEQIKIKMTLSKKGHRLSVDFGGTQNQVTGNLNCPLSVSAASVYYVFMCMLPDYTPCCRSVFDCIDISAPQGCVLNALPGAAVAAGNVETSMRVVDVFLGGLDKLGIEIPAASQGSMNNIAMGSRTLSFGSLGADSDRGHSVSEKWDYYETIAGGCGANSYSNGLDATHSHMTNTLNTPIESLEMHYPLRIERYDVRVDSGGVGKQVGGDGVIRSYRFLKPAECTLLTERRDIEPWGLSGGMGGKQGENRLNGNLLPSKIRLNVDAGDVLSVATPGGGGFGS